VGIPGTALKLWKESLRALESNEVLRSGTELWKAYDSLPEAVKIDYGLVYVSGTRHIILDHQPREQTEKADSYLSQLEQYEGYTEQPGVDEFLDSLPEQQREMLYFKFYDKLTVEQIAVRLGVSDRTVQRWWYSVSGIALTYFTPN